MKKKVLIIEDNEQNMYMLGYLLRSDNYDVMTAFSATSGIIAAERSAPDIILLDIQLPEMDGYAVAAKLRAIDTLKETPIITVTSYAMPGDKERALAAGATGYIEKPINPDTFIDQMKSFLPTTDRPGEESLP